MRSPQGYTEVVGLRAEDPALAAAFLESFLSDLGMIAGSPSFDIGPGRGDARRQRRGLSPADVRRLEQANPAHADKIREMYMPGPSLPRLPGV